MENFKMSGVWSKEKELHINILELRAVGLALKAVESLIRGKVVIIVLDNSTALAYFQKSKGTAPLIHYREARQILEWAKSQKISLLTCFVAGNLNVIADGMSRRGQVLPNK